MNTERILELADHIERLDPSKFNMSFFAFNMAENEAPAYAQDLLHNCGTCGCIAGWTNALYGSSQTNPDDELSAAAILGLDYDDADDLFHPNELARSWNSVTPSEGARVLRHLAETGEVDWGIIDETV